MSKKLPSKVSEIKLTYKSKVKAKDRPQIHSSRDAHRILKSNWSDLIELQEEFNILLLDRSNRVMGICPISKGGIASTQVDLRIVFATALKGRASSIILAHNHPSGNVNPSGSDMELTRTFIKAGQLLNINVFEHIILSPDEAYFSFADEGLMTLAEESSVDSPEVDDDYIPF